MTMEDLSTYLESGILELYVAGSLPLEAALEVENLAVHHPEIQAEIVALQLAVERIWDIQPRTPRPELKARIFEEIAALAAPRAFDPARPPVLHAGAVGEDYRFWLELEGIAPPATYDNLFYIPVAMNEDGLTAVVWINGRVVEEMHDQAIEKFLVLEGSCKIDIEGDVHYLKAGDYLAIPKFRAHVVDVTSDIPCKLIVQRIAA
jgi:mannose-6-phosphate isomerase-like protein (cupin superfamily)